jgi:CRISPR-associated RAMP protein (TIGR02581 family)
MMFKWFCQADTTVRFHPVDPILIKSGYATIDGPDMVPVSTFRHGRKTYYFPGSSLKGALRSHFERIARTLKEGSVCLPYYDQRKSGDTTAPVPAEAESFGCSYRGRESASTSERYRESCAACRLFGSLRFGGRFSIGDAYPLEEHEPKTGQRNGVGIDRFTGGTVPGVLFDLVVLEGGIFESHLRVVNFELWQLAAVYFLLTDLRDELITIGSGRSRGLGRVRGEVSRLTVSYVRPPTSLSGLGEVVSEDDRKAYGLMSWQPPAPVALPTAQRRGLRHEYDLTAAWDETLQPLAGSLDAFLQWHGGPQGVLNQSGVS